MNDIQWYDYFRLGTAILAFVSMFRLSKVIRRQKQTYSSRLKDFLWLIYAFLFTQTLGSLETVLVDGPYKYSIFLSFFTACVAFRATRRSDTPLIT